MSFEGVEKVYAVQAGREVRILVRPDSVDDDRAREIARDVVKRIEEQLSYPGQIRVTVIRETRAVDYAR
jgi:ribonuclease Y